VRDQSGARKKGDYFVNVGKEKGPWLKLGYSVTKGEKVCLPQWKFHKRRKKAGPTGGWRWVENERLLRGRRTLLRLQLPSGKQGRVSAQHLGEQLPGKKCDGGGLRGAGALNKPRKEVHTTPKQQTGVKRFSLTIPQTEQGKKKRIYSLERKEKEGDIFSTRRGSRSRKS